MAELDSANSRELKKTHGDTDITREISILEADADLYVVQVQDVYCKNGDPRYRCRDIKECFRTSRRSIEMSQNDAVAHADRAFARSVDLEEFKPHPRLSESRFVSVDVKGDRQA